MKVHSEQKINVEFDMYEALMIAIALQTAANSKEGIFQFVSKQGRETIMQWSQRLTDIAYPLVDWDELEKEHGGKPHVKEMIKEFEKQNKKK